MVWVGLTSRRNKWSGGPSRCRAIREAPEHAGRRRNDGAVERGQATAWGLCRDRTLRDALQPRADPGLAIGDDRLRGVTLVQGVTMLTDQSRKRGYNCPKKRTVIHQSVRKNRGRRRREGRRSRRSRSRGEQGGKREFDVPGRRYRRPGRRDRLDPGSHDGVGGRRRRDAAAHDRSRRG